VVDTAGSEGPRPDVKVASDPVAPSHFLRPPCALVADKYWRLPVSKLHEHTDQEVGEADGSYKRPRDRCG